MRLQIASDLHLEFPENRDFITLNPLQIAGDILILAGDIVFSFSVVESHQVNGTVKLKNRFN